MDTVLSACLPGSKAFYTPETEIMVKRRFTRDIEYFGYEFERSHDLQYAKPMGTAPWARDRERREGSRLTGDRKSRGPGPALAER